MSLYIVVNPKVDQIVGKKLSNEKFGKYNEFLLSLAAARLLCHALYQEQQPRCDSWSVQGRVLLHKAVAFLPMIFDSCYSFQAINLFIGDLKSQGTCMFVCLIVL